MKVPTLLAILSTSVLTLGIGNSAMANGKQTQDGVEVKSVVANEMYVDSRSGGAFRWGRHSTPETTAAMSAMAGTSTKPSLKWGERIEAFEVAASPQTTATTKGFRWGIRSAVEQQGFRWGIRSAAEQQGFRWGIRSAVEQQGFRWGIRSAAEQQGFRWGIRSAAEQQGFRWGIRSAAEQQGYRWGIRSAAKQQGFRWGIR